MIRQPWGTYAGGASSGKRDGSLQFHRSALLESDHEIDCSDGNAIAIGPGRSRFFDFNMIIIILKFE